MFSFYYCHSLNVVVVCTHNRSIYVPYPQHQQYGMVRYQCIKFYEFEFIKSSFFHCFYFHTLGASKSKQAEEHNSFKSYDSLLKCDMNWSVCIKKTTSNDKNDRLFCLAFNTEHAGRVTITFTLYRYLTFRFYCMHSYRMCIYDIAIKSDPWKFKAIKFKSLLRCRMYAK